MSNTCFRGMTGLVLAAMIVGGCAKATVEPTMKANRALPKPDFILVNDFAVTSSQVKLDRGLMATAVRDTDERSPSDEEMKVGQLVAEKLTTTLVDELREAGIAAARSGPTSPASATTAVLSGQFVTIDQGNQSERVWLGFGLGGSELRTRIQISQAGALVASGETATKASLKPGMLASAGAAGAAGSAGSLVTGAASTGLSEAFLSTVEADARRTAQEVAKKIRAAYVERGWLAK